MIASNRHLWRKSFENLLTEKGFVLPAFENYGRINGLYNYGPIGSRLMNNIQQEIRRYFVREYEFDEMITTILTIPEVLKNSGHIDTFEQEHYLCENCEKILDKREVCGSCGLVSSIKVKRSALFRGNELFLRPETTHTMINNFSSMHLQGALNTPVRLCQIGAKVFRDEVSPRNFNMRMKEFQIFEAITLSTVNHPLVRKMLKRAYREDPHEVILMDGGERKEVSLEDLPDYIGDYGIVTFIALFSSFLRRNGVKDYYFERVAEGDRAHYSSDTWDIMAIDYSGRAWEIGGIANRTNFDLLAHKLQKYENLNISELSIGLDRLFYVLLSQNTIGEDINNSTHLISRITLPKNLTPYHFALFPLIDHEELIRQSKEIFHENHYQYDIFSLYKGSIGKRYKMADLIGIRYSLTIDFQTLEDDKITIRDAITKQQQRISRFELSSLFR